MYYVDKNCNSYVVTPCVLSDTLVHLSPSYGYVDEHIHNHLLLQMQSSVHKGTAFKLHSNGEILSAIYYDVISTRTVFGIRLVHLNLLSIAILAEYIKNKHNLVRLLFFPYRGITFKSLVDTASVNMYHIAKTPLTISSNYYKLRNVYSRYGVKQYE